LSVGDRLKPTTSISKTYSIQDGKVYLGSPPPRESKAVGPKHGDSSFGVVWVNDIGRSAMASAQPATFPAGSIIVREKLAKADDTQPELLAVMIKQSAGFSRATNDWEYLVIDGAMKKVRERHTKGACHDCHTQQKDRDFVFPVQK